jgi:hypothetical protein
MVIFAKEERALLVEKARALARGRRRRREEDIFRVCGMVWGDGLGVWEGVLGAIGMVRVLVGLLWVGAQRGGGLKSRSFATFWR